MIHLHCTGCGETWQARLPLVFFERLGQPCPQTGTGEVRPATPEEIAARYEEVSA